MDISMLKNLSGLVSIFFGLITALPYFIQLWRRTAKPHVFSWLTWGTIIGLGFILSDEAGGGQGAWIFAIESISCFIIAFFAIFRGEKNITRLDIISFTSAMVITVFYVLTRNAIASAVLAATIDLLGFVPTVRKSYMAPHGEPALNYFFSFLGFFFSLLALREYNFVTIFYPLTLVISGGGFVLFLLIRRKAIPK